MPGTSPIFGQWFSLQSHTHMVQGGTVNALEGAQAESPSKNTHKVKSNCQNLPFSCTPHYSSCPQTDSLLNCCSTPVVLEPWRNSFSRVHSLRAPWHRNEKPCRFVSVALGRHLVGKHYFSSPFKDLTLFIPPISTQGKGRTCDEEETPSSALLGGFHQKRCTVNNPCFYSQLWVLRYGLKR